MNPDEKQSEIDRGLLGQLSQPCPQCGTQLTLGERAAFMASSGLPPKATQAGMTDDREIFFGGDQRSMLGLHGDSQASGLSALDRWMIQQAFIAQCGYIRNLAAINATAYSRLPEVQTEWQHTIRRLEEIFGQWYGEVSDYPPSIVRQIAAAVAAEREACAKIVEAELAKAHAALGVAPQTLTIELFAMLAAAAIRERSAPAPPQAACEERAR